MTEYFNLDFQQNLTVEVHGRDFKLKSTELTTFCIQIPVTCDSIYTYDKNIEQCEIS